MDIPAFPAMHYDLADNEHGLTMRDYFAARAMPVVKIGFGKVTLTIICWLNFLMKWQMPC